MELLRILISFLLMAYLSSIVGLPIWLSAIIVGLFIIPPFAPYLNMALSSVLVFISLGIHLYTVIFAFSILWWKGLLTIVLPWFSQIYWFFIEATSEGYKHSIFCIIMLSYLFCLFITNFYLIFFSNYKRNKN